MAASFVRFEHGHFMGKRDAPTDILQHIGSNDRIVLQKTCHGINDSA